MSLVQQEQESQRAALLKAELMSGQNQDKVQSADNDEVKVEEDDLETLKDDSAHDDETEAAHDDHEAEEASADVRNSTQTFAP